MRSPGEARLLGLWTAGCLAVLLLGGILWVGDLSLQWPLFAVPLVWALVAVRPRRSADPPPRRPHREDQNDREGRHDRYPDAGYPDQQYPATREAPTLPPLPPPGRRPPGAVSRRWDR